MRARRPRRWHVQRDIQLLIRTFPSERVTFVREKPAFGTLGQRLGTPTITTVYSGEALIIPATGEVQTFGLGQVENKEPQVLVAGTRDIQQGDYVTLKGRKYQVTFEPNAWHGFLHIRLKQYQQGT